MENFSKEQYTAILRLVKKYVIDFHTEGPGVILRHDVDDLIEKSVQMAELEHEMGIKSTYFILNTAGYWAKAGLVIDVLRMQNELKHEIGWHNNAISDHLRSGYEVKTCIYAPITTMRISGVNITGSASHGDPLCHERNYLNYNVFGFQLPGWTGYQGEAFDMKDFGLEYEAYHVQHDEYLSDSGGVWKVDPIESLKKWIREGKQVQVLVHPQHWQL